MCHWQALSSPGSGGAVPAHGLPLLPGVMVLVEAVAHLVVQHLHADLALDRLQLGVCLGQQQGGQVEVAVSSHLQAPGQLREARRLTGVEMIHQAGDAGKLLAAPRAGEDVVPERFDQHLVLAASQLACPPFTGAGLELHQAGMAVVGEGSEENC